MLKNEWADKNEIAKELSLGPRRVLGLAKQYAWRSKDGTKTQGKKTPLRLFATADVRAYQARLIPPIDQSGQPVPAPVPQALARRAPDTSGLVAVAERIAAIFERSIEAQRALPAPEAVVVIRIEPHRYVSLREAARHIGLSAKTLERACDAGVLSYVEDRGRRVVRLRDVEEIDFGFSGRSNTQHN